MAADVSTDVQFSIVKSLNGTRSILLTGVTGFLGSVVLELALRCSEVPTVYVLLRPSHGRSPQERLRHLLRNKLFHLQWDMESEDPIAHLLQRVKAIPGDLTLPHLGLEPADRQLLQQQVQLVIHCAARVQLEEHIWSNLETNYFGTLQLLQLAQQMTGLQTFLHVSSAYVNINQVQGEKTYEQLYPLVWKGQQLQHQQLVGAFMGERSSRAAQKLAQKWCSRLNYPGTYCLVKHLAEQLVLGFPLGPCFRVIVRPALISAVAHSPYPGYAGNFAGPAAYTIGYALGFFQGPSSVAYHGKTLLDLIPADVVAATVLAAAAEAVHRHRGSCSGSSWGVSSSSSSSWHGSCCVGKEGISSYQMREEGGAGAGGREGFDQGPLIQRLPWDQQQQQQQKEAAVHGFCIHPLEEAAQQQEKGATDALTVQPCQQSHCQTFRSQSREQQQQQEEQQQQQQQQVVIGAPIASQEQQLLQEQGWGHQRHQAVIYHSASSMTHPLPTHQALAIMRQFYRHNTAPLRLPLPWPSRTPVVGPGHRPRRLLVLLARGIGWAKLQALCLLLRVLRKQRQAVALKRGFSAWCIQNSARYNRSLLFSSANTRKLQGLLQPEEHSLFPLLWTPQNLSWESYGATLLAGQQAVLMRGDPGVKGVEHSFVFRANLASEAVRLSEGGAQPLVAST